MTNIAQDAFTLRYNGDASNDAALKQLLGTAAGKDLRVGPEHFLSKTAKATPRSERDAAIGSRLAALAAGTTDAAAGERPQQQAEGVLGGGGDCQHDRLHLRWSSRWAWDGRFQMDMDDPFQMGVG